MDTGWSLSSSDDEDSSILPQSELGKRFANPSQIKTKRLKKLKQHQALVPPDCSDGKSYQRNSDHVRKNYHSSRSSNYSAPFPQQNMQYETISDPLKVCNSAAPYNIFLTTCNEIPSYYNYSNEKVGLSSMGIKDILSESFGMLMKSVQFNYCIDIDWLINQYPTSAKDKPLLIVHGSQGVHNRELQQEAAAYPNVKLCRVDLPPYGTHHTKMMLLHYCNNAFRIVISTANLVSQDWNKKTQGFYLSPIFAIKNKQQTEQQSKFKTDLIEYLAAYKKEEINRWIEVIKNCDVSDMDNIRLIGSVPGRHAGYSLNSWGHMKLRSVLKSSLKPVDSNWPVIGQFSSIGSLGTSPDKWLCGEWLTSLSACNVSKVFGQSAKQAPLKLIFPTVDNVRCSLEGYPAGASLPYSSANEKKQKWLLPFLHQWKADHVGRSNASPHIKSYVRVSPYDSNRRAAWFLLTSANLSKAAWGSLEKKSSQLALRSFELGVLFFPRTLSETSQVSRCSSDSQKIKDNFFHFDSNGDNRITLPFSYPLTRYSSDDCPWTWDSMHTDKPDRYGNVWHPS